MANYTETSSSTAIVTSLADSGVDSDVLDIISGLLSGTTNVSQTVVENGSSLSQIAGGTQVIQFAPPSGTTPVVLNLKDIPKEVLADIKVIIANGDAPVQISLVKEFSGVVTLGDGDNSVVAKGSNDVTVQTGTGDDSIKLASGSDSVVLGGGSDSVKSGGGNDTVTVGSAGASGDAATVVGGGGTDVLDLTNVTIESVIKANGFIQIETSNGYVINIKSMETFIFLDATGQETTLIGSKIFITDWDA